MRMSIAIKLAGAADAETRGGEAMRTPSEVHSREHACHPPAPTPAYKTDGETGGQPVRRFDIHLRGAAETCVLDI